jgi:alkylation response protein AidB-like acyl-CoA dehydrogenase
VLDGDEWIVSGQKVWNTSAHHADLGLLLARTNWDLPKHQGITYFALPMRQPGVEIRPLRQMNYHSSFNEVFLTEARIPKDWIIGELNEGWKAALVTLAHERRFGFRTTFDPENADPGLASDEAAEELRETLKVYSWYPQRAGRSDLVCDHARAVGCGNDSVVRQEIARLIAMNHASQWTAWRARANRDLGRPLGAEGSIGKLALSQVARQAAKVHSLIGGANGMLAAGNHNVPFGDVLAEILISVPAQSIAGGTDEIQRNILAERVLGLPREPDPTKDLSYRHAVTY